MSAWSDVLIGIAAVAGTYYLFKALYNWNIYRRSIQREIYSNFFEYYFRKKNLTRLSESSYFKSRFGKHRICYQLAQNKNEKNPQAYIIIILTSGLYILNVKNQNGRIAAKTSGDFIQYWTDPKEKKKDRKERIYPFKNPLGQLRYFISKVTPSLPGKAGEVIKPIVVFPEKCEISWEGKADSEIEVINSKALFETIRTEHEKHPSVLNGTQIDQIFHLIADEAIEMEKNQL